MMDDLISMIVVTDRKMSDFDHLFTRENGFVTKIVPFGEEITATLANRRTDILLIDAVQADQESLGLFRDQTFARAKEKKAAAVFLILKTYPDEEERRCFYDNGCDQIVISPFDAAEIKKKFKIYGKKAALEQSLFTAGEKIEKTTRYLDTFKEQLRGVKTQLYDERISLNSALKQINRMTEERSRLKMQKKELAQELDASREGFLNILGTLVKNRVEKNKGHGERVAHIAAFAGKEFNLDEKALEDLEKAAMLHEVGLLLVPAATLDKPVDQLDDYEKDLMLQYPVKGADFLKKSSQFDKIAQIIQSLNENCDGTGYPNGLKRRYIPLTSRILAGADTFDTIKDNENINNLEDFLTALEDYSGTRLDPSIVSVLEKYAVLHMGSDNFRVKGVGIHQLEPGMVLGTAIFSNTGTKLFSVNTLLTQKAIDKIKKYNREYPVDETVYIKA